MVSIPQSPWILVQTGQCRHRDHPVPFCPPTRTGITLHPPTQWVKTRTPLPLKIKLPTAELPKACSHREIWSRSPASHCLVPRDTICSLYQAHDIVKHWHVALYKYFSDDVTTLQSHRGKREHGGGCDRFGAHCTALLPSSSPGSETHHKWRKHPWEILGRRGHRGMLQHSSVVAVTQYLDRQCTPSDSLKLLSGIAQLSIKVWIPLHSPHTPLLGPNQGSQLQGSNQIQSPKGCWQCCWQCSCNTRAVPCRGQPHCSVGWAF